MNDISVLLILLALSNRNGFDSIKKAVETADSFNSKISGITNIMSMLPKLSGMMGNDSTEYVDTLKDIISRI